MLINFRIAFRHLWKNKLFSIINILGLSLGLACCFVILLHVKFELSYDQFHIKMDRIVRVLHDKNSYSPIIMTTVLPDYFPEIENIVRIGKYNWLKYYMVQGSAFIEEKDLVFADSGFFDIFTFPVLAGNLRNMLRSPDKIMLSETMTRKYFGNENPLGKVINLRLLNTNYTLTVEGIFKDFPEQSHFHANFIVSIEFYALQAYKEFFTNWGSNCVQTYLLLKQKGMEERITKKLPGFIDKYVPKDYSKNLSYSIQPLKRIHLDSNDVATDIEQQNSRARILIFASIAVLVLIIAVTNFVLLSLALSYQRIKEFGIRKVVGAKFRELVSLVSIEFLIVFVLAMQIALMLVEISIPVLKSKLNINMEEGVFSNTAVLILFILTVVLLGYIASIYITAHVARLRPVDALKNNLPFPTKRIPFRGGLVIFQFIIMTGLLSCLIIMQKQIQLLQNRDLGFRKEQLLNIEVPAISTFESTYSKFRDVSYQRLKNELKALPGVINVSGAGYLPPSKEWWASDLKNPLTNEEYRLEEIDADYDLVETMEIQIKQGRAFSRLFGMDSNAIMINESAIKTMGLKNPLESYLLRGEYPPIHSRKKIIGVFKDFNMRSLYEKAQPMFICLDPGIVKQMCVRLASGSGKFTLNQIEKIWKTIYPDEPIQYTFVDEGLRAKYLREDQTHALISMFAFLSMVIALMGLFGLSAFSMERRTKETGIRKVNGAGMTDIFVLLSKQFINWIAIAFIVATPVAWYAMHRWLQHFAYKTELSWWVFALSGIISVCVALLTISWQSYKAAIRNPVETLRYE